MAGKPNVVLIHADQHRDEISGLQAQLFGWPLFDARVTNHLDRNAAQCRAENVPDGDTGLYEHFKAVMTANALHGTAYRRMRRGRHTCRSS
jgi:hypothetical protein